jgi:dTDP-3-amino-3,4,6-trideoxy-alpha-D-glucose transaminase
MKTPFNTLRPLLLETRSEWSRAMNRAVARGRFILDRETAAFEREFAAETGSRYAAGVGSGTAALELCLRAAGLYESGAEVLTSPLTAPFTAAAIRAAGCRPRFADVESDTLLLSPDDARRRVTTRTAAIIPVHLYGQPCDLKSLRRLSEKSGAALVQDACQAHGALCDGVPFTVYSPYVAYSFYPTKNLGCLGDGGAVTTNAARVDRFVRRARDGGRRANHISETPAINSRLDELQACFLRVFLKSLRRRNEERRALAELYEEALQGCPGVRPVRQRALSVYHLFVIRAQGRERLRAHLRAMGIETAVHYPKPLHLHPAFRECGLKRGDLPDAERACREVLSLPLWPEMPAGVILRTAGAIRAFYANRRERRWQSH